MPALPVDKAEPIPGARELQGIPPLRRYFEFLLSVGFTRIVGMLLGVVTLPFIIRKLGAEMFGVWSYVGAILAFTNIVANPGISTFIQQQVSARREEAGGLLAEAIALRFAAALLAVGIIIGMALLLESEPKTRAILLGYGVPYTLLTVWSSDYLLGAMERFHEASFQMLLQQGLYAAIILVCVRGPADVIWVIAATLISIVAGNLFGWACLRRLGMRPRLAWSPASWRMILRPSADYALASFFAMSYGRCAYFAVRWFLGDRALGLFAAATRLIEVVFGFVSILHGLLQPRLSLRAAQGAPLGRILRLSASGLMLLGLPLAVGGWITAPGLLSWALGPQYADSIPLFQWSAPYFITAAAASFYSGTVLYAFGRHRAYLASTAFGAVVAVLLCLALIPALGLVGACIVYSAAQLAVAVCAYFLGPREISESLRGPLHGTALAGTAVMALALTLLPSGALHPLAAVALGACVYLAACAALGGTSLAAELRGTA